VSVVSGTDQPEIRLRADARRNRDQIIAAARELFIDRGADVPMEEIARAATVGVGTLYRRFPDRDELIRAVTTDSFHRLWAAAVHIEATEPDSAAALTKLVRMSQDLRIGLILNMLSPRGLAVINKDEQLARQRTEMMTVLDQVVHRAQADGSLRADVDTGDVVLALTSMAKSLPRHGGELREIASQRMVALMLDGLRAAPGEPLPGRPVTATDLETLRTAQDDSATSTVDTFDSTVESARG
jgi:AcrR family transcriptional regulator